MGWLLSKLDHLPEPLRLVIVNALLWAVNDDEAPPFDGAPLHDEPIAPKASRHDSTCGGCTDTALRWPGSSKYHCRRLHCWSLRCARQVNLRMLVAPCLVAGAGRPAIRKGEGPFATVYVQNGSFIIPTTAARWRLRPCSLPPGSPAVCVSKRAGVPGLPCPFRDDARRYRSGKGDCERCAQRSKPRGAFVHPGSVYSIVGNTTSAKGWRALVRARTDAGPKMGCPRTKRQVECHLWICGRRRPRRGSGRNLCGPPLVPLRSRIALYGVSPRTRPALRRSHL